MTEEFALSKVCRAYPKIKPEIIKTPVECLDSEKKPIIIEYIRKVLHLNGEQPGLHILGKIDLLRKKGHWVVMA
jgi:hypothetical protein